MAHSRLLLGQRVRETAARVAERSAFPRRQPVAAVSVTMRRFELHQAETPKEEVDRRGPCLIEQDLDLSERGGTVPEGPR
jgi:hypothetical protein